MLFSCFTNFRNTNSWFDFFSVFLYYTGFWDEGRVFPSKRGCYFAKWSTDGFVHSGSWSSGKELFSLSHSSFFSGEGAESKGKECFGKELMILSFFPYCCWFITTTKLSSQGTVISYAFIIMIIFYEKWFFLTLLTKSSNFLLLNTR